NHTAPNHFPSTHLAITQLQHHSFRQNRTSPTSPSLIHNTVPTQHTPSSPTRRSSDLTKPTIRLSSRATLDLVDQAPLERGHGVDGCLDEREGRGAVATDAARDARGAAGAGNEAHRDLRQHEGGRSVGDDASTEGGQLDA